MSQMDSTKETIGEYEFEVLKLDPLKSLEALNVVKEVVAPALGQALGAVESLGDLATLLDDQDGGGKLGGALEKLLMAANYGRQKFLIDTFRPVTRANGKPVDVNDFALIFRGDIPLMFRWMALCFKAEWGNVEGALSDAIGGALKRSEQPPTSQST